MTLMISRKNSVGETQGSVMCQCFWKKFAPSMAPASYSASSTFCSAAMRKMKLRPMFIQTVTAATEGSA